MKRVFAMIGFTVAITLFLLLSVDRAVAPLVLVSAAVLFVVTLVIRETRRARVLPTLFGSIVFACVILLTTYSATVAPQRALAGQTASAQIYLIDLPEKTMTDRYSYLVKASRIDAAGAPQNIRLRLYTDAPITADYYEEIDCTLSFYAMADDPFDSFSDYGNGVYLSANVSDVTPTGEVHRTLHRSFLHLRETIRTTLLNRYSGDEGGLAVALLIGDKSAISDEVIRAFRLSGVSHAMAVSGLHIGILFLAVQFLLMPLYRHKRIQVVLSLGAVFFYIALADFSKSSLRAGVMIALMLLAKFFDKRADTLNSLGVAVFLLCLNPYAVTDVSAQLTVTAMLGVLVVYPQLLRLYAPVKQPFHYLYTTLCASLSVILCTLPVLWLRFGRLSLAGVVLNIIFIPLLQVAVIGVAVFLLLSPFGWLAALPRLLSSLALKAMLWLVKFTAAHFSYLYADVDSRYFGLAIGLIFVLLGFLLILHKRLEVKAVFSVTLALLLCAGVFTSVENRRYEHLIVTAEGAVIYYDNDSLTVLDEGAHDVYLIDALSIGRTVQFFESDMLLAAGSGGNGALSVEGENIFLTICNYRFAISPDCVTIGESRLYRDVKRKFGRNADVAVHLREGSQLIIETKEG